MKIEDQLAAKPDLSEVNIPKGIYENMPTIENLPTVEDEAGEDVDAANASADEKLRALVNTTTLSQNSIEQELRDREQLNTSTDIFLKEPENNLFP